MNRFANYERKCCTCSYPHEYAYHDVCHCPFLSVFSALSSQSAISQAISRRTGYLDSGSAFSIHASSSGRLQCSCPDRMRDC
jgi:hypothetical protein